MVFKKVPEELDTFMDEVMQRFAADKRRMFGCPCWFVKGNMFAGAFEDSIFVRLSEADRRELFQDFDEAAPFEPLPGRSMKEYAMFPASIGDDREVLDDWLDRAYAFARSRPRKAAKAAKKPSARRKVKTASA